MAIPSLFIVMGALLLFYYSNWTFDFGFTASFFIPMGIIFIGLILALRHPRGQ